MDDRTVGFIAGGAAVFSVQMIMGLYVIMAWMEKGPSAP